MRSRQVYYDCMKARDMLKFYMESGQREEARVLWVSCITLLRSIGYVLAKVDTQKSQKLKNEVDCRWKNWKEEEIFDNFIDEQRANALKEYVFSVFLTYQGKQLTYGGKQLTYSKELTDFINEVIDDIEEKGTNLINEINQGLQWWNEKLSEVEQYY